MSPHAAPPKGACSALFTPLNIGNGTLTLSHRVVLAPCTRNRGVPLNPNPSPSNPNRIWIPDELIASYYAQRATPGGLLITEALPISIEASGMPGVPGIFCAEQVAGWKAVVDAVHARGGYIYAQLWHVGRAAVPQHTGLPAVSSSVSPFVGNDFYSHPPPGTAERVRYRDYPPIKLTVDHIKRTIADYVRSAKLAVEDCGFDGIEVHGANGYLPEQFLNNGVNKRTDDYGGSPEKRCKFVVELMEALCRAIGENKVAIRLSPFGLFNEMRGTERVQTWTHLCQELKKRVNLSYVHFMEPRYEQIFSVEEKDQFLAAWGISDIDLTSFRTIFGSTPFFSAGGWNDTNVWGVIESGAYDGLAIGRFFLSNPDLIKRLKEGHPFVPYDRSRFYGPFTDREFHYSDYVTWEEQQETSKVVPVNA